MNKIYREYATLISICLQLVGDETMLSRAAKALDESLCEDESEIKSWIVESIENKITSKREMYDLLKTKNIDSKIMKSVSYFETFSLSYCESVINKFAADSSFRKVDDKLKELYKIRKNIRLTSDVITRGKLLQQFYETAKLFIEETDSVLSTTAKGSGIKYVMLDPEEKNNESLNEALNEIKIQSKCKIKINKLFDGMLGGGATPSTVVIPAAIGANFKSGLLQNMSIYASINNKREDLQELMPNEEFKPYILFVSKELNWKQIVSRHLSWFGMDPNYLDKCSIEELEMNLDKINKEYNIKIPVIYVDVRDKNKFNCFDIQSIIEYFKLKNLYPCLISIDYIDRIEPCDPKYASLGDSGNEGATKLRIKGRDIKQKLAEKYNVPVIAPAQLNREAQRVQSEYEPYVKVVDRLTHYSLHHFAGSASLQTEVDKIIFCEKVEIPIINSDNTETKDVQTFIAVRIMKDRDGDSIYVKSDRDKRLQTQYESYTRRLLNSAMYDNRIIESSGVKAMIKLDGYRLSDTDYAESIRYFYPNESSNLVSIDEMFKSNSASETSLEDIFN